MQTNPHYPDVRTLLVYGLNEATADALRRFKSQMDVEYRIMLKEAQTGAQGRVVAFQPVPWLVSDGIAYVKTDTSIAGGMAAIHWAVNDFEDKRVVHIVKQLESIFGPGVKEIPDEQLAYERISKALDLGNEKKTVRFR